MGGGGEHRCEWREKAESLGAALATSEAALTSTRAELQATREELGAAQTKIAELGERFTEMQGTLDKLQRHVFGRRSEKMPSVSKAIRDPARAEAERIAALQTRRENAEKKRKLVTRHIEHPVAEEKKVCPKCGGHDFSKLGDGKTTELYELIPAIVERQLHIQEKLRCRCGETILMAEGPAKVFDKTRFGPNFMAQVAVSKCADALPLYRQAKAYRRVGVQVDDSTLGDLFHRTAEMVDPLYERLLEIIAQQEIVLADETTQRVQEKGKTRTAWLWSFIGRDEVDRELIAYVFSTSRSGETPVKVLGETKGKLVADAYSGYNKITTPGRRERAGCLAHLRRHFFEAQSAAPDAAKKAMDYILDLYRIERGALEADILGTPEHLAMRQTQSKAILDEFKAWLLTEQGRHPPRGGMGQAIGYALGNWDALTLFLTDAHLPVDNNASERALRIGALGRNYADTAIMRSSAPEVRGSRPFRIAESA